MLKEPTRHYDIANVPRRRIAFIIDPEDGRADQLRTRPEQANFILADASGLLFRDAAAKLVRSIPPDLLARRKETSDEGIEFNWGKLEADDIPRLFDAVLRAV